MLIPGLIPLIHHQILALEEFFYLTHNKRALEVLDHCDSQRGAPPNLTLAYLTFLISESDIRVFCEGLDMPHLGSLFIFFDKSRNINPMLLVLPCLHFFVVPYAAMWYTSFLDDARCAPALPSIACVGATSLLWTVPLLLVAVFFGVGAFCRLHSSPPTILLHFTLTWFFVAALT